MSIQSLKLRCQPLEPITYQKVIKQTATLPETKKLYRVSEFLNKSMYDQEILSLTEEQIDFYYAVIIENNPKIKEQLENTIHDPEFDEIEKQQAKEDEEQWKDI